MEIRFANEQDDKQSLARLIYRVDPFIYPYWFNKNEDRGVSVLKELLNEEKSIFYYKNCIVAKEGGELVGIFPFIPPNAQLTKDYGKYNINFESNHVIQNYILDVINNLIPNDVCVVGLYVESAYRRRHIASKMFGFLLENFDSNSVSLEVLANNYPAIELYNKFNFKIIKTYYGYNGYRKRKPLCHVMQREIEKAVATL